jgi:hypothetical protein
MMSKIILGKDCTLWRNNSAPFPFEVADLMGLKPGEKFRYVVCSGRIEVEKVN